jgi:repressor LexA
MPDYDSQGSSVRPEGAVRKGSVAMRELSARQEQILDLIRETVASRGYPPSVREIGEQLGLSSPSTVHSHLSALVKAGYLRRDPSKPRAIEVVDTTPATGGIERGPVRDVPLVGRIAAGTPILAEECIDEVMPLPESMIGSGPVFMLEVHGDSMVDAGIMDGDYVIIRSQKNADNGEIVACLVDGEEATVKRFEKKDGQVLLHSENPAYGPMVFDSGVEVLGKVVAVFRSLR